MTPSPRRVRRKTAVLFAGVAVALTAAGSSSRPALAIVVLVTCGLAIAGAHAVEWVTGTRRIAPARRDERRIALSDGTSVLVRPLRPADEGLLREAFDALSAESRYQRFMGHVSELSDWMWTYLCSVDGHDHVARVAVDASGRIVGIARFIREHRNPASAELAVTVADAWQGRGLGIGIVRILAEAAREVGVHAFVVHALARNMAITSLMAKVGETSDFTMEGGELTFRVHLRGRHDGAPFIH